MKFSSLLSIVLAAQAVTVALSTTQAADKNSQPPATAFALPKAGPQEVRVNSRWSYSADENRPAAERLLERARTCEQDDSSGLDKLVRRWPDVTLDLLRDSVAGETDVPLRIALAHAYDRVFDARGEGWAAALKASSSQRKAYGKFSKTRGDLLALFQAGRFSEAAKLDLVAVLPNDVPAALKAEALRVAGLAALLDEKPDRAADLFAKAVVASRNGPRHAQFEIGLLSSEAERRRGRQSQAAAAWKNAVSSAENVRDPDLWERAILGKAPDAEWPAQAALIGEADFRDGAAPDNTDVLIGIGKMRLARGAAQSALLAFSRAESETNSGVKKALARLYRAQSMIVLQQAASALPMLEVLTKTADPRIARRAQAIEGDVLCRVLNDCVHGIPMLRDALGKTSADDGIPAEWPGKNRLVANLGLYLMVDGRGEEGLRILHQAQARFESEGQWDDLAEALKNEAASLRVTGKNGEAKELLARAEQVGHTGPRESKPAKIPEPMN